MTMGYAVTDWQTDERERLRDWRNDRHRAASARTFSYHAHFLYFRLIVVCVGLFVCLPVCVCVRARVCVWVSVCIITPASAAATAGILFMVCAHRHARLFAHTTTHAHTHTRAGTHTVVILRLRHETRLLFHVRVSATTATTRTTTTTSCWGNCLLRIASHRWWHCPLSWLHVLASRAAECRGKESPVNATRRGECPRDRKSHQRRIDSVNSLVPRPTSLAVLSELIRMWKGCTTNWLSIPSGHRNNKEIRNIEYKAQINYWLNAHTKGQLK